jgi:pyruvate dehydrogenase E2 component (dihydrolipoamide acetyltransferase)
MISEVVMPQMGADMTEGTLVRWLKREGEDVQRGEIIAEIETDKANVEIEAFESGVFRKTLANEGDTVAVGAVIAVIASPDEDVSEYEVVAVAAAPAAQAATAPEPAEVSADEEVPVFRPRERPAAARPEAAPPAPATNGRVRASPVARKLARERGIDLSSIAGIGPDGRIVRRDVEAAIEGPAPTPHAEPAMPAVLPTTSQPAGMSRMRQTIARRMSQSKREAPHYYVTMDVDMAQAEATRHQLNDHFKRQHHVAVNDVVMKATAMALAEHPEFNALFLDGEVRPQTAINLCLAIAVDEHHHQPGALRRVSAHRDHPAAADRTARRRIGAQRPRRARR